MFLTQSCTANLFIFLLLGSSIVYTLIVFCYQLMLALICHYYLYCGKVVQTFRAFSILVSSSPTIKESSKKVS